MDLDNPPASIATNSNPSLGSNLEAMELWGAIWDLHLGPYGVMGYIMLLDRCPFYPALV